MDLTESQKDALRELINIGYGRAASSLSDLTGARIVLEVPRVSLHPIAEIQPLMEGAVIGEVATVNQAFSGAIAGNAVLLLDERSALTLAQIFLERPEPLRVLDEGAREIITEVGNILLNACLGTFGNLLQIQVSFAVPRLHVETMRNALTMMKGLAPDLSHALMIHTRFRLATGTVEGFLVIILGLASLDRLIVLMDRWEKRVSDAG